MTQVSLTISLPRTFTDKLPQQEGQTVKLLGFLHARRDLGGLQFIILRDLKGIVQGVGHGLQLPLPESSIEVIGKVIVQPKAPGGYELQVQSLRTLTAATEVPPVEIPKMQWQLQPETLLDYRVVTVRGLKQRAVLKVQAELIAAFRDHLISEDFTEISTPKIVSAGAESGANLFPIDYFGRSAYLAQSPQLYKQIMVGAFERVFEIALVYRAEEHATSRHLNEYLSLDVEMGFIDSEEDVMDLETRVLKAMVSRLKERMQPELALLNAQLPIVPPCIPRITLMDARQLVAQKYGHSVGGKDLDPEAERLLSKYYSEVQGTDFVFVTKYPRLARPFYAHPDIKPDGSLDAEFTRGFDLLFRGIEITSGGQRIHDYAMLQESIAAYRLNPATLEGYTEVFKYGMPPHGGFAIGAERLTAKLLGISNIRYARSFVRDRWRLTP